MLYAVLLYGALLTPILALPALLLMERLDRWVAGAEPRSAGAAASALNPGGPDHPRWVAVRVPTRVAGSVTGERPQRPNRGDTVRSRR